MAECRATTVTSSRVTPAEDIRPASTKKTGTTPSPISSPSSARKRRITRNSKAAGAVRRFDSFYFLLESSWRRLLGAIYWPFDVERKKRVWKNKKKLSRKKKTLRVNLIVIVFEKLFLFVQNSFCLSAKRCSKSNDDDENKNKNCPPSGAAGRIVSRLHETLILLLLHHQHAPASAAARHGPPSRHHPLNR